MQIAVAATPEVALPTLDALLVSAHDLVAVITQPDRPAGRGLAVKESPVAIWPRAMELPFVSRSTKKNSSQPLQM